MTLVKEKQVKIIPMLNGYLQVKLMNFYFLKITSQNDLQLFPLPKDDRTFCAG